MTQPTPSGLHTLRSLFEQVPDHLTERDAVFLHTATTAILCGKVSSRTHAEQTARIVEHVTDFITYRAAEQWVAESTYLYRFSESVLRRYA